MSIFLKTHLLFWVQLKASYYSIPFKMIDLFYFIFGWKNWLRSLFYIY